MKVVVAGGTGFLGRTLCRNLADAGHDVVVLTRSASSSAVGHADPLRLVSWVPDGTAGPWAPECEGADAFVNLAGESIAARRWSAAQKARISNSRMLATRGLVAAIHSLKTAPSVFLSGSAVGYYGSTGNEVLTEESSAGEDFLARVCIVWEAEAMRAASARTRVVTIRTGLVLDRRGGALPRMVLPFRFLAGGPVGSGRQYVSWIHEGDWQRLALYCLQQDWVSGPVNATAPNPVTNTELSAAIGRAVGRPSWMPVPAFAIRTLLGEMGDALLLSSQRAIPAKARGGGFEFTYTQAADALAAIFE
jgi:uncharacterized protein (TIGR01777 family)